MQIAPIAEQSKSIYLLVHTPHTYISARFIPFLYASTPGEIHWIKPN